MSRFFDASRISSKSARADEDSVGKARSPREAAQGERIARPSKATTDSHGSIVAGGTQQVSAAVPPKNGSTRVRTADLLRVSLKPMRVRQMR